MKIISLKAENFKRLTAVEINPEGNMVVITGKNEAGKSSVLDSIWSALGGKAANPVEPVRKGAATAEVTLDLGDYVITRQWDMSGTTKLTVKAPTGAVYKSPQALLDGLMGAYTFDPAVFLGASEKEQRTILMKTIALKPDWSKWKEPDFKGIDRAKSDPLSYVDTVRKTVFDQRTEIAREAKRLEAAAAQMAEGLPTEVPTEKIVISEVIKAREVVAAENRRIESNEYEAKTLDEKIAKLKGQIADALERVKEYEEKLAEIDNLAEPVDLAPFDEQIEKAESHNSLIDRVSRWKQAFAESGQVAKKVDDLKYRIEEIDLFKKNMLESAKLPIPGLGFDLEGGITLNEIPFGQCSHSQRLKAAMAIAMAGNPELRVMRVSDGEKFDSESWKIIEEMAADKDFQVWIEKMDESGEIGIYIEDGQIGEIKL